MSKNLVGRVRKDIVCQGINNQYLAEVNNGNQGHCVLLHYPVLVCWSASKARTIHLFYFTSFVNKRILGDLQEGSHNNLTDGGMCTTGSRLRKYRKQPSQ